MNSSKKKVRRYSFTTLSEAVKDVQRAELSVDVPIREQRKRKRPRSPAEAENNLEEFSPSKKVAFSPGIPGGGCVYVCTGYYNGFHFYMYNRLYMESKPCVHKMHTFLL